MKRLLSWLALAAIAAACGSADQLGEPASLQIEMEGRYGSLDGALSLNSIRGLALTHGNGDTVLVSQIQVPGILLMSSGGDSLAMIGRGGSGPGEFSTPSLPSIQGDTIWVQDQRGPLLRFDTRGEYIDQLALRIPPLGEFQYAPQFRAALADGSLLMVGVSNPVGPEARAAVRALAHVRVGRDGTVMDTVALLSIRESSYVLRFSDGTGVVGGHPAANPDLGAVDPHGRWVVTATQEIAEGDRYGFTLRWIATAGDTLAARFIPTEPVSNESTRAGWVDRLIESEGKPRGMVEAAVADVPFPPSQAPALRLFADAEGRAWVQSPHTSADSARWYVIDREQGDPRSVVLENEIELMASRADRVWGWTRGSFDEAYIVKFRMTW